MLLKILQLSSAIQEQLALCILIMSLFTTTQCLLTSLPPLAAFLLFVMTAGILPPSQLMDPGIEYTKQENCYLLLLSETHFKCY